jgi:hypothetical protein
MYPIVVDAIRNRRILMLDYAPGQRMIEPHALGYSREGYVLLRAFQTEGASASGEHIHWKLFRMDRAHRMHNTGESFGGPRPLYRREDSAMKGGIIAQL